MEFHLHFHGRLKGNARANEKHQLRKEFHKQLAVLWNQYPLQDYSDWLTGTSTGKEAFLRDVNGHSYVPLVNQRMHLIAGLDILMLRPEEPGAIITQSGDIDNRLKTLFDALRIPHNSTEAPNSSSEDPEPFFCLLEDDNLIDSVAVKTGRLLTPSSDPLEVVLTITVNVKVTRGTLDNLGLGF